MNKLNSTTSGLYINVLSEPTYSHKLYVTEKKRFFILKRFVDITFSAVVCLFILSWMIPVVGILIKLSSKGPIFFVQKRVGFAGKSFMCLKFRTMIVNQEANLKQASEGDQRITAIGNFLRNTNLDEFPQFVNVLLGHMSIVGPRPHMHADANNFSAQVKCYKNRYFVKPGITGLAQVKGYRGMVHCHQDIFHRYQFDAFYVRNASFGLDFRIIRLTAIQTLDNILDRLTPVFRKLKPAVSNYK